MMTHAPSADANAANLPQFQWKIRVYYEDTDAGGIVFYANYLKFFERARTEWLRAADIHQQALAQHEKTIFVVSNTNVQYHLPARLDDELTIITLLEKLGHASVQFMQQAWRGEELLCSGQIRVGCVQSDSLRPRPIPKPVKHALQQHHVNGQGALVGC